MNRSFSPKSGKMENKLAIICIFLFFKISVTDSRKNGPYFGTKKWGQKRIKSNSFFWKKSDFKSNRKFEFFSNFWHAFAPFIRIIVSESRKYWLMLRNYESVMCNYERWIIMTLIDVRPENRLFFLLLTWSIYI